MKKVFVLGSINMDYCINTLRMPLIGESKDGHSFFTNQGGKGANQAIACKKLGVDDVYLISAIGNDDIGLSLKKTIEQYSINTNAFQIKENVNSGACIILFDEGLNDNALVVDKGANDYISFEQVEYFLKKHATKGDIFITQLEVNIDTMYKSLHLAKELGMYTILNPAPVVDIDEKCYKDVDIIIPNQTEVQLLTKINVETALDAKQAFDYFNKRGINEVIITLGKNGSYYVNKDGAIHHDIVKTTVIDTTSAGDTFIGALAYKKALGYEINESMDFASLCSSITVSRKGAGKSIPTLDEVNMINNR